ncbi:hypothetical protein [Streptomyces sp. AC627_RSS907]|uniref:hypothetical protein n=1 Tax=Streptomyces sp. AC627_RSS907 TaxID=2823684 RepID=UPI001C2169EC|nr:hypothetical protein [Streptomyces sp. AC627_RSS907]
MAPAALGLDAAQRLKILLAARNGEATLVRAVLAAHRLGAGLLVTGPDGTEGRLVDGDSPVLRLRSDGWHRPAGGAAEPTPPAEGHTTAATLSPASLMVLRQEVAAALRRLGRTDGPVPTSEILRLHRELPTELVGRSLRARGEAIAEAVRSGKPRGSAW